MKRARVHTVLHWQMQEEKKEERGKKVHFWYVLTGGRSRFRQENIYRDKEEPSLKRNKLHKICS